MTAPDWRSVKPCSQSASSNSVICARRDQDQKEASSRPQVRAITIRGTYRSGVSMCVSIFRTDPVSETAVTRPSSRV